MTRPRHLQFSHPICPESTMEPQTLLDDTRMFEGYAEISRESLPLTVNGLVRPTVGYLVNYRFRDLSGNLLGYAELKRCPPEDLRRFATELGLERAATNIRTHRNTLRNIEDLARENRWSFVKNNMVVVELLFLLHKCRLATKD